MTVPTPYYLLDEQKLQRNLEIIRRVRDSSGAKFLLALKCFATWAVFDLMREHLDGTTSSSLFEARLGYEKFGKETHAYCVGYTGEDISAVRQYADKVIFNSLSQLQRFAPALGSLPAGLRVNPGVSCSQFDLADPGRRYSRLGVADQKALRDALPLIDGVMFHFNCENDDFDSLTRALTHICAEYGDLLSQLDWVSFGGGIAFTKPGYPVVPFGEKLREIRDQFHVQLYFEPGESVITRTGELVTTVVDIVHNEMDIAIVDASTEAHMLDLLTYRQAAQMENAVDGPCVYMVAGRSCLAGDVFGVYHFPAPLEVGQTLRIADAAGYSIVKKNWFNGLNMPSIVVRRLNGETEVVRTFGYQDYVTCVS